MAGSLSDGIARDPATDLPPRSGVSGVRRNTVADTWDWMWKDTAGRVLPFAAASALYARLSRRGPAAVGLTPDRWVRDVLWGNVIGIPATALAIAFRRQVAPMYRLPTPADQTLQTAFYLALNAPVEEVFWRGTVQNLAIDGLKRVPRLRRAAVPLGWAATTAAFGAYHRLGKWSWRSIGGVTLAGGLFGAAYLLSPRRSLLPAIIIHGYMTAGFLSWGDATLHWLRRRQA
ncbi:MAG: CPBP family intramembrane glutamic endopeptidase [Ktedonobacterales bacterium]